MDQQGHTKASVANPEVVRDGSKTNNVLEMLKRPAALIPKN
jgi:hypothetical protein